MKVEFTEPEGLILRTLTWDSILGFKAVVYSGDVLCDDGIIRPTLIEFSRGETAQEAVDRAAERIRARLPEYRSRKWVAPTPQRAYNKTITLDLSVLDTL